MNYVCVHGHFYQPSREDPHTDGIAKEASAYPFGNWNERIWAECYRPNAQARLLDSHNSLRATHNNYSKMSFNFGPTLLNWLEIYSPKTYRSILHADEDSAQSAALAQGYHHSILPLCNRRDKQTEIRWGLDHFKKHFGRKATGFWLPETAVDTETLEALVEEGIQFTVLAPHQASAVRAGKGHRWISTTEQSLDCSRVYQQTLPTGKSIALFFYDGGISQQVAFHHLLRSGDDFAKALTQPLSGDSREPRLVSIATDGESYGHHHRFGEMALARAFEVLDQQPVMVTNYASFLQDHPPTWQVKINEQSSWSCAHGIERWRGDCGCGSSFEALSQHWRKPLREAFDRVRESVNTLCGGIAAELFTSPWDARDDYIRGWGGYLRQPKNKVHRQRASTWLKMQQSLLRMDTSCGWFFGDLNRIEPKKNIQYAQRALRLCAELSGHCGEEEFLMQLESISSGKKPGRSARQCVEPTAASKANPHRQTGVLLPVSALPNPWGIGDLGKSARKMVDWLASAGVRAWQILPTCPTDLSGSPYSSWSDFAGSPLLIDIQALVEMELLSHDELPEFNHCGPKVDYPAVVSIKIPLLEIAAQRFLDLEEHPWKLAYKQFCERASWLDDYALFVVLRDLHDGDPWWQWPRKYRDRLKRSLTSIRKNQKQAIDVAKVVQFFFETQLTQLRTHCEERGITLMGDLPFYVSDNSVDVWAHQDQFHLDGDKRPTVVSGAPPDAFTDEGQLWGNPIYDWERMQAGDYAWWKERFARSFERYDIVRIDHFRGFSAYWEIPAGAETAAEGEWVTGPGLDLIYSLKAHFKAFPVVVEDLGVIDQAVRDLVSALDAPGMKVLQFAFNAGTESEHLPINYSKKSICYTGTHDTNTALGWWLETDEASRDHVRRYLGVDGHDIVWDLIRLALSSVANLAVIPMQDLSALDGSARMNTPGTTTENWTWRMTTSQASDFTAHRLKALSKLYGR